MKQGNSYQPLADRMRPRCLAEVIGQQHLLADGKPLHQALRGQHLHSMVFWGPPGTGKTTLARLMAQHADAQMISLSAVLSGVKDIREAIAKAKALRESSDKHTILFIDEVHRFNKSQQDAFLPHVEDGTVTFIGATTENPSFELNKALLSRARIYVLKSLQQDELLQMVDQALQDQARGVAIAEINFPDELKEKLVHAADGDGRRLLNMLELLCDLADDDKGVKIIHEETLAAVISGGLRRFDKGGEEFYDQISALHKSVRGSDPDAALYWLARMLDGGCEPLYIARRVVRMATEDIGNADPRALQLCLNAWDVVQRLGSPEGELALAQAVVYLAVAAKSNAVYTAFKAAMEDVQHHGSLGVPLHLRNTPTKLMKDIGYGKNYRYAHDEPDAYAKGETYFPDEMKPKQYYKPVERGLEIQIKQKLASLKS